jgi:hypothetical protein
MMLMWAANSWPERQVRGDPKREEEEKRRKEQAPQIQQYQDRYHPSRYALLKGKAKKA